MEKTIIRNLPNEEYHHGKKYLDYISSSQLKLYAKSPAAFRYGLDHPTAQTDAMRFGSLFHELMASCSENFSNGTEAIAKWFERVAVFQPPVNPKTEQPYGAGTKVYAEAYQQFLTESEGKIVSTTEELSLVSDMSKSMLAGKGTTSQQICKLLKWAQDGESSYFYEDENGIKMKVRPDLLTSSKIIDWKTCSLDSLDEESIASQIIKYGYHISLAMYQFVLQRITGKWYKPYLVFVSKVAPHDCVICNISDWCYFFDSAEDDPIIGMGPGALEFQRLLGLHTKCVKENNWPGVEYSIESADHVMKPSIPKWYERKFYDND